MSEPVTVTTNWTNNGSEEQFPTVWKSLGFAILYVILPLATMTIIIVFMTIFDPVGMAAAKESGPDIIGNAKVAMSIAWSWIATTVLVLGIVLWNLREPARAIRLGLFALPRLSLARTALTAFILLLGSMFFNWAYQNYVVPGVELQADTLAFLKALDGSTTGFFLKVIIVAVLAPLVEELIFRGYLQTSLMSKMSPHFAIWTAALIFAVIHFQIFAIPGLMVLGAAFGYLYHRTGSLLTCIVLHMVNNAAALVFSG
jgi:uncharacterized protein